MTPVAKLRKSLKRILLDNLNVFWYTSVGGKEKVKAKDPTQAELMEVFEIRDGKLYRKERVSKDGRKCSGRFIESVTKCHDYCRVWFKGRTVYYHRIASILLEGQIEEGKVIDHVDGNPLNNDISNLRQTTVSENNRNRRVHREGRTPGITYCKTRNMWRAWDLKAPGKPKHVGYYKTEQEAVEALKQYEREMYGGQEVKTKANA